MDTSPAFLTPVPEGGLARIGLLAAQGRFPQLLARAAKSEGVEVTCFAFTGYADEALAEDVDKIEWVEFGQADELIQRLHENGIQHVALAGRIPHNVIWKSFGKFDKRAMSLLFSAATKKANSLLGRVCEELRLEGIEVVDSTMFLRSLMPKPGQLTKGRKITRDEREDIAFGMPIARAIAGQDIGQTIIVRDKAVVAVEALEGTDRCIERAATLLKETEGDGSFTMIKVSKPRQDRRFDVPVIGVTTIKKMAAAGAKVLAVSAEETLIFDREEVISLAEGAGIVIIAEKNPPPESNQ